MNLQIKGKLVSSDRKPLASKSIQIFFFDALGRERLLVTGKTTRLGTFLVKKALNATVVPRLILKYKAAANRAPQVLTDDVASMKGVAQTLTVDFGTVEVQSQQVFVAMGRPVFGVSPAAGSMSAFSPKAKTEIATLKKSNTTLLSSQKSLETLNKTLATQLNSKNSLIKGLDLKLKRLPEIETEKKTLAKQVTTLNSELSILKKVNKDLLDKQVSLTQAKKGSVRIEDFTHSIGSQLSGAQRKALGSGFQIGKVSMEMKIIPSSDGQRIIVPSKDELESNANSLSILSIDYLPPTANEEAQHYADIPDVVGDSETGARRALEVHQLKPVIRYQAVKDEADGGRVLSQNPSAGTPGVGAWSSVSLIVGELHQI